MGTSASKAANDIGSVIANALAAPFKSLLGRSCEDVCAGTWDVVCFIEHICVADLVKLLLICGLGYICLIFLYLLYKLGVCQCVVKCLCKMCWAACEAYWLTLDYICCFCWHKIRYTKRVYRGRHHYLQRQLHRDVELGYPSTSTSSKDICNLCYNDHIANSIYDDNGSSLTRKRKSRRGRRRRRRLNDHKNVRMNARQVSVHLKGRSRRGRRKNQFKHFQKSNLGRSRRNSTTKFKRPRLDEYS